MTKLSKFLLEGPIQTIAIKLLILVLSVFAPLLYLSHDILMEQYKKLTEVQAFRISISLFVFLLICTLFIFLLIKKLTEKININNYSRPEELGGVSKHKKTGDLRCTSCLVKNILSPVRKHIHYWICLSKDCGQKYPDPSNPVPEKKRQVLHHGIKRKSWIHDY